MGPQQGGTHVHVTCSMALTPEHMPRRFEPSTRPLNGACAAPVHACAPRQTLTLSPSLISQPSTAQPLADGNRRSSGVAAARLPQHPRQARPPLSRARGRTQSVASPRQARPPPSRASGRTQSVARGNRTPHLALCTTRASPILALSPPDEPSPRPRDAEPSPPLPTSRNAQPASAITPLARLCPRHESPARLCHELIDVHSPWVGYGPLACGTVTERHAEAHTTAHAEWLRSDMRRGRQRGARFVISLSRLDTASQQADPPPWTCAICSVQPFAPRIAALRLVRGGVAIPISWVSLLPRCTL